jgi:putative ABC transport system permease protein
LSLGDNHRGFPAVGTSVDYFQRLRYANGQSLRFNEGRLFAGTVDGVFEAVLGHDVARRLGYRLGQPITLTHGMALSGVEHDDKPFVVVGILAPTGTPVDRSVHISLQGMTALHLDWAAGALVPGLRVPAEHVRKFDLQPPSITAALVGLKNRAEVFRLQRHINEFAREPLMTVVVYRSFCKFRFGRWQEAARRRHDAMTSRKEYAYHGNACRNQPLGSCLCRLA